MPTMHTAGTTPIACTEIRALANKQLAFNNDTVSLESYAILDINDILKVPTATPLGIPVREFLKQITFNLRVMSFDPL